MKLTALNHQRSKEHTDRYRPNFALNRNSAGLTSANKESTFTLVCDRAKGPYVYDIDGNEYIDLTMGFGSILLGHGERFIEEAIEDQLRESWSVGPISPLAGQLAQKICRATNNERAAFFNSGTEAVMVAMRLAKAATSKKYIVFFKGAYHGTYDSLLSMRTNAEHIAQQTVPGITQNTLDESYLLDYGTQSSLDFIRKHKDDIAGVLVEPVQSRRPDFVPIEYLKDLRELTEANDIALIFDEIITGFRMDVGGCQSLFGVQADIVTYGKVIGGGLPIGVVAGRRRYLDYTDGGTWQYQDDSMPQSDKTFVAGTFCHHPLAMRSALTILEYLEANQETLYTKLNVKTYSFVDRMNKWFEENELKIKMVSYGSLFRFVTPGRTKLIYQELLERGVYIWEGRNCFLSPAHSEEVVTQLEERIKESCEGLR